MKIRDFIYLDSGRMYSLYSQAFEGIAEKVTNTYFNRLTTGNATKKGIAQDTAKSETEETLEEIESKVMYDNLYNKLEDKLSKAISVIDRSSKPSIESIRESFLFKVIGNACIFDYIRLVKFTDEYNKLGEVISTSIFSSMSETSKGKTNVKQIAKDKGLSLDKTLLSNLKYVAEFFNKDSFEILVDPFMEESNIVFSGNVKRAFLRIDEDRLRHLYGNEPCMQWIMVGQLTNVPNSEDDTGDGRSETERSLSDSYENMMRSANEVEKLFSTNKRYTKIRLAPIAIYVEKEIEL